MTIPKFAREKNVITKPDDTKKFGLIFPDTYDIGMSGMTIAVVSTLVNALPNWQMERFFLPWNPYIESKSIEHGLSLGQVDVIGVTAQFEVTYLALGWLLRKAAIPLGNLKRKQLKGKYPPVLVGGPCAYANPFPLMDLVDGFFLGDSENSLPAFLRKLEEVGADGFWSNPSLFESIKGFWSPHFLDISSGQNYSDLFKDKTFEEVAGAWHSRFEFVDLNKTPYPLTQVITELPNYHPYAPYKGQSFQLEIGRGCDHTCRFCMISRLLRKGRYRSLGNLIAIANEGAHRSGVNHIDLFGTNLSDFPDLKELCWTLVNQGYEISLATLRPDRVSGDLIEALYKGGQRSLTIATETGTERLRRAIGKPVNDEKILSAVKIISDQKIPVIKNFFLTGLPTETDQDREALIELVRQEYKLMKNSGVEDPFLKVDINPFVPKWHTPFSNWVWYYLPENRKELSQVVATFYRKLDKMVNIKPKQTPISYSLAQAWITHMVEPINPILEKLTLISHHQATIYAPFFLELFKDTLDGRLREVWKRFESNEWEITHPIQATGFKDELFTKEYTKAKK